MRQTTTPTTGAHRLPGEPADHDMLLVSCQNVSITFGEGSASVVAVHGSDASVTAGSRVAIAGPSGSGKSTLLHLMAGFERPTSGTVTWPALPEPEADPTRDIGVVFQSPSLVPTLNVFENVALPLYLAGEPPAVITDRVRASLQLVGAGELENRLPDELSGGQAQRVAVARVLAQQPRLILADEPTGQLDHDTGQRVVDALLATADELGAALIVTTHDEEVAQRLATRWSMHDGRLQTTAPVAGVLR
ncbi:MAG: ABC transporter ATP-binding protein [Terracoccus sp.]